jgi:hypothetical protein
MSSLPSRSPAGEIKPRALVAAKILIAAEHRLALGKIALALRIQNHLLGLGGAAMAKIARSLARRQVEIEQGENEKKQEEQNYQSGHYV